MVIHLDYVEDFMVTFIAEVCACTLVVPAFEMSVSESTHADSSINLACVSHYILVRSV